MEMVCSETPKRRTRLLHVLRAMSVKQNHLRRRERATNKVMKVVAGEISWEFSRIFIVDWLRRTRIVDGMPLISRVSWINHFCRELLLFATGLDGSSRFHRTNAGPRLERTSEAKCSYDDGADVIELTPGGWRMGRSKGAVGRGDRRGDRCAMRIYRACACFCTAGIKLKSIFHAGRTDALARMWMHAHPCTLPCGGFTECGEVRNRCHASPDNFNRICPLIKM